ncbi:MAG: ATP phosphoribosyltransferase [Oscillospiraceae bacterium]|nr:ATP phosphoribosyltransferase [Oscillospiraceae bacterium]
MREMIKVALPKGRLYPMAAAAFARVSLGCPELLNPMRKLTYTDAEGGMEYLFVKPGDVPAYVEYGAADMGVTGKDTLLEEGRDLSEAMDMGFGRCRVVVAGLCGQKGRYDGIYGKRIATKYPNIAKRFFESVKGESVEVIRLSGSIELAPLAGLADAVIDLVDTGETLRENGMEVYETVAAVSARLVVNGVSMKMKGRRVKEIIARLGGGQ